ncbi:molybdopterin-dependent oxidoreductase [Pseudenhygromyxa sp. WMMC2535]|uniref:molybdopterin-containing oxidoreductase family protein n=1 Tax=Pseudenhygromyxa sp. WMMC2535 TaxID=2712867 RepID=UPI001554E744|nr:molybdopterin-dependent oxidoreductase [Pseudenhygromyxa sp. WMMC2535]NVB38385.1 molybdopterin-dependent oxidoreductase [Pseudenhygromyxa sp. WMMC2535]
MKNSEQTHQTFCRICEALCGLEVSTAGGRITQIRPDPEHVATGGFACVKGLKQYQLYDSPDRLTHPLRREPGGSGHEHDYARVSWERALAEIGAKLEALKAEHGPDSIAMYVGTAAGFGVLHPIFAQGFMTALGSRSMYASATQDCANKFAVARELYGFCFTQPFPDLERCGCLIVVGANPAVSKWSFLQVSNPVQRLKALERRGCALYFVDPRRTESAKAAGEHVFIRPNTDPFFYLAFLHEVLARGAVDRERLAAHMRGFAAIEELAAPWTPERCAQVTKIPAHQLRAMVDAYLAAEGAALYSSTGVNMGSHGSIGFWLQEVINAITGNLDRPGGTLVGQGVIDFPKFGVKNGLLTSSERSRVGGFRAVNDAFPGGTLADEILTPGKGKIRALIVTGGNPLLTMANAGRLREALGELELLVCLDIFQGETASLAHYVLPCTSPMQRPDLPFIFPLMLGMQSKPYLQATREVVAPQGEQRDEATIYLDLCRAAGVNLFDSRVAQRLLEWGKRRWSRRHPDRQPAIPQELLLDMLLRVSGQGSFGGLLAAPHGRLRPAHAPGSFLGERVLTEDGKLDLAPAPLMAETAKLEAHFESERRDANRLKLITKRAITTHNSWTHNIEAFARAGTNHLYVHPEDAARLGLVEGGYADVRTDTATVRVPVAVLEDLMPGTVALPHGWGHQHARGLSVAGKTRGVNVNLLAADGPEAIERVSGMSNLTGFVVDVRPAAGEFEPRSWSGIG